MLGKGVKNTVFNPFNPGQTTGFARSRPFGPRIKRSYNPANIFLQDPPLNTNKTCCAYCGVEIIIVG